MSSNKGDIESFEKSLGYSFKNRGLLRESLTHSSYSYENNLSYNYERLEFLGDAVIEMIVSEYIVTCCPDFNEGSMSSLRAYIVNETSLSGLADFLGLGFLVYLGKGEDTGAGALKKSILADIFEAVIAAVYLDGGYFEAKNVLVPLLEKPIGQAILNGAFLDSKSEVQRICQQLFNKTPEYRIVSESGPDHEKVYIVETDMCGLSFGSGSGPSKKKAEKAAAETALKNYYEKNKRG